MASEVENKLKLIEFYRNGAKKLREMASKWWKYWPDEIKLFEEAAILFSREAGSHQKQLTIKDTEIKS